MSRPSSRRPAFEERLDPVRNHADSADGGAHLRHRYDANDDAERCEGVAAREQVQPQHGGEEGQRLAHRVALVRIDTDADRGAGHFPQSEEAPLAKERLASLKD